MPHCLPVSLLGAPLFTGSKLDRLWSAKLVELERAVKCLSLLGVQEALVLLRASFKAPRVRHLLRYSPSVEHEAIDTFDSIYQLYTKSQIVLLKTTNGSSSGFQFVMVAWAYEMYPRSQFPPSLLQRQVFFLSRVSFYRKLLFSRTLSSLHSYHVGWLSLEVH